MEKTDPHKPEASLVPTEQPWSSFLLEETLSALSKGFPFLEVQSIGESVMGKPLYLVKMGKGPKALFCNGAHHANEWITTPLLLRFLEAYAEAYKKGGELLGVSAPLLYEHTCLYLVPMVNPDGVDLVTGALSSGEFYTDARILSESYPNIPFPSGWKANIRGTDLNLNYPAGWEEAKRIKFEQGFSLPGPRDYVGKSPLSAPESKALYELTERSDFLLSLSYHTQGRVIFWKYLDLEPPCAFRIGEKLSAASGYGLELTPYASGFAGYKDYFIQNFLRPGYTVEAGLGENPLPLTQFPRMEAENRGLLLQSLVSVAQM